MRVIILNYILISVPSSGASTGGKDSGTSQDVLLELQYMRNNITALQSALAKSQKVHKKHTIIFRNSRFCFSV